MQPLSEDSVREELSPREKLVWFGQPRQGIFLRAQDALLIPFSLLWGGFAIFWECGVVAGAAPRAFALFGIPFVLVGLYLIFGRFWVDAKQRASTAYGVTSERVIIVSGIFTRQVKSLNIDALSDLSLEEKNDRTGTITFGVLPRWAWMYFGSWWPSVGQAQVPQFDSIADVRSVYAIIRDAQKAAKYAT